MPHAGARAVVREGYNRPLFANMYAGALPVAESPSMDAPDDASILLVGFGARGQVLSSIRPHDAAGSTPRAIMENRGPGPDRLRELDRSADLRWFSRSRLIDRLPLPFPPSCPHPRRLPATRRPIRRRQEPGNSASSSSPPRRCAPSCWPGPRQPASVACAPASWRARDPALSRGGPHGARPPWRR